MGIGQFMRWLHSACRGTAWALATATWDLPGPTSFAALATLFHQHVHRLALPLAVDTSTLFARARTLPELPQHCHTLSFSPAACESTLAPENTNDRAAACLLGRLPPALLLPPSSITGCWA
jgi:hypothetical protein